MPTASSVDFGNGRGQGQELAPDAKAQGQAPAAGTWRVADPWESSLRDPEQPELKPIRLHWSTRDLQLPLKSA